MTIIPPSKCNGTPQNLGHLSYYYSSCKIRILKKSLGTSPDETQLFDNDKMDLTKFDEIMIGRVGKNP